MSEPVTIAGGLAAERWATPGEHPLVVLLHSGVTDRRGWRETAGELAAAGPVLAYDRRGYGESPPGDAGFVHLDDLLTILAEEETPVWLVGSSQGGAVALEAALAAPELIAGLVLIAPAVPGAPPPEDPDPETIRLDAAVDEAVEAGNHDEAVRLELHLWLDGPEQEEGRVGDPARALAREMNEAIYAHGAPEGAGGSDTDVWSRLGELELPVTVAYGELDVPFLIARACALADRLPHAEVRSLPGLAHLPYLEAPGLVADVVREAIAASR